MSRKELTRRIRLYIAPPNSRRGKWFRHAMVLLHHARQTSPASLVLRILPSFITKPLKKSIRRRRQARLVPLQAELQEILHRHSQAEQVVIFPPSLDWHTQLFQRPQQLALALARQGALVFYLQRQASNLSESFLCVEERLYLSGVPIEVFEFLQSPLIYLLTWNRNYASAFHSPRVIYDYVDEIEVFYGRRGRLIREHEQLVRNARLVVTTAERLYQQVLPLRADAILCPNGVDYEQFASQRRIIISPPQDLIPILTSRKPIVGYYGALAVWFDYQLLQEVARRRPDLMFILIGPDYDGTLHPQFLAMPNIFWLGVKPYAELPAYLRYFDVAMIPFQLNDITHSTSPLKLFEYMAGGKPVVITPMQESMRYDGVLVADGAEDFSRKLDQALELRDDPDYVSRIDRLARQNTWQVRARQLLNALKDREL